ncbi:MAG: accessory gene regulator ArgB-like protein [Eubacteriales bacterium]
MSGLLESWAESLALHTKFTQDDSKVFSYTMKVLLTNLGGIATLTMASWVLGIFDTTMSTYLSAVTLRIFTGGKHAGSHAKCYIMCIVTFCGAGFAIKAFSGSLTEAHSLALLIFTFLFSGMAIYLYAPVETPNKPIKTSRVPYLKNFALFAWGTWFIVLSLDMLLNLIPSPLEIALMAGILLQTSFILPVFNKNRTVRR